MNKEDKKFNLKGLLIVIIVVNIFLAVAAYFIDLIYWKIFLKLFEFNKKKSNILLVI